MEEYQYLISGFDNDLLDYISPIALSVKKKVYGDSIFIRGLIEISNICKNDCLYCGIRCGNCAVQRYELSDEQILHEAQFALDAGYGSVVLQGGERTDSAYVERIARLVRQIKELRPGEGCGFATGNNIGTDFNPDQPLGITLSLGEQSREVYKEWYNAAIESTGVVVNAKNINDINA